MSSHPSPSPTHEIFFNYSLRNGWNAVAVRYEDDSSFAKVRFEEGKYKTQVESILPTDYFGGFLTASPALQNAPPSTVDYLIAAVSAKIQGDKLDRKSEERHRPSLKAA